MAMVEDEYPKLVRMLSAYPLGPVPSLPLEPQLWPWIAAGLVVGELAWWWFKPRSDGDLE
jgi:hypothetical protein